MEYMEARMQDRYEALSEDCTQTSDSRPVVAEQQGGDEWLIEGDDPLEIAQLVRNFYRDHNLPIAVMKAAILVEMAYSDKRAAYYYRAAQWHDKQAAVCEAMARDEPRLGPDIRARAAENAKHHRGSAAGLRLAATGLERKEMGRQ